MRAIKLNYLSYSKKISFPACQNLKCKFPYCNSSNYKKTIHIMHPIIIPCLFLILREALNIWNAGILLTFQSGWRNQLFWKWWYGNHSTKETVVSQAYYFLVTGKPLWLVMLFRSWFHPLRRTVFQEHSNQLY